ncbi:TM0106 family RecB-like putative nuclease [Roseobacter sp. HKCCA0434]|uniref:TM0106 family RecB-like putative nuclease n=1 Tax=Roseobacter sp. HKCCA0434 TaxID=3079297 RepID=UPI002905F6F7|nr:TM0106 family RecB-like putative nuclease [Roseobacter sp. HKCCA0434]
MQRLGDDLRLSATDLMRFAVCPHATRLDLARLHGEGPEPADDSADARLLQRRGDLHEEAHLDHLKADGGVVEIARDQGFGAAVEATQEALRGGARHVFQGALEGGMWGGWSDFLERVERPSQLGDWSYEVADTKLKRKPAPGHVLQLVLYSDLLARVQGTVPERAHVVLGDGARFTFRLDEVSDYARAMRDRLENFVAAPPDTRAVPCAACPLCRWREHCAAVWEAEDSLFRIAGIARGQVAKIEAAGVTSMAELSRHEGEVPRLAAPTLDRLRMQASLQTARPERGPHHALRPAQPGKGFDLLPPPHPEDLFYDIEGDPHYEEGGTDGLEYLHGIWAKAAFTAVWAHDRAEEKAALSRLMDLFAQVLEAHPGAHVYHYAPYEITALKRLTMQHGLGEARLDRWLRAGRFVDLYAVVRNGIFASEPSYSIKDMEALYGFARTGEVTTAGGSVVAYEAWREEGDGAILDEIEHYNRLDCVSTEELRDWLLSIRPEGTGETVARPATDTDDEKELAAQALHDSLMNADLPEGRGQLLYDLAQYHPREKKPVAWAVFDAAAKDVGDLCEDLDCLGGLTATGAAEAMTAKSRERTYRWPAQETKLRAGADAAISVPGEPFPVAVTVRALDRAARSVTVRTTHEGALADRIDLLPSWSLRTQSIETAIANVIEDQLGPCTNGAAEALLSRALPTLSGNLDMADLAQVDPVEAMIRATRALDGGVLPVQGPPGTGKTYVTARAILALVRQGRRVGVCSNSHDAIRNVLMGCIDALEDDDTDLTVADLSVGHKQRDGMDALDPPYDAIVKVPNAGAAEGIDVVGGTAWLFSSPDLADAFDTIFVDEAGQVPLANALALTQATRNLVLVGDPAQLPQVVQGAHPHPAGLSCLDWMLGGATTIPAERGLFLPVTRRMQPELATYISRQFYEGRLSAHPDTARQSVEADGLPSTGAWRVPVAHDGRVQHAPEEVAAIEATIDRLLNGRMTDREGRARALRPSDIIVVAPYNLQVNALTDALHGIRCGTVDRFQGQEAQVVLVSMTASSAEATARGLDFLLSRQRMNVAISRGKALSLVFAAPRLTETACTSVEHMRLVNALCALPAWTLGRDGDG